MTTKENTMATHTDQYGDHLDITAGINTHTSARLVNINADAGTYAFTPQQARQIAADLIAAANALETPLITLTN